MFFPPNSSIKMKARKRSTLKKNKQSTSYNWILHISTTWDREDIEFSAHEYNLEAGAILIISLKVDTSVLKSLFFPKELSIRSRSWVLKVESRKSYRSEMMCQQIGQGWVAQRLIIGMLWWVMVPNIYISLSSEQAISKVFLWLVCS